MIKVTRAAATIFAICGVAACFAQTGMAADHLKFQYQFSMGNRAHILTGIADGSLAADGNHFTVEKFESLKIDHVESVIVDDTIILESADYNFGEGDGYNGNGTAVITLDGSYFDLSFVEYYIKAKHYVDITGMTVGDVSASHTGPNIFSHLYHPPRLADDSDTGVWTAEIISKH